MAMYSLLLFSTVLAGGAARYVHLPLHEGVSTGGVANYVHLPQHEAFSESVSSLNNGLEKRANDDWLDTRVGNNRKSYGISFELGTPGQEMYLVLDTGSSDVWVMDATNPFCSTARKGLECQDSSIFDSSKSSTFSSNDTAFFIHYADDKVANGSYAQDSAKFGDSTLKNFNFGHATFSNSSQGIAGVGFPLGEAAIDTGDLDKPYKNLPQQLKDSGIIGHTSYSLWLNAQSTKAGSILFGGIDKGKFTGDMYRLPVVESEAGVRDRLSVKLDGLSVINEDGDEQRFTEFDYFVTLDSGSTTSTLPASLLRPFAEALNAEVVAGIWVVDCEVLEKSKAQLGIQLGGIDILIPFNELGTDLGKTETDNFRLCIPGFLPGSGPLLGDNILRKLYVVYDLENYEIGLATAKVGDDLDEDIEAISSGIPGTEAPNYSSTEWGTHGWTRSITILGSGGESTRDARSTRFASDDDNSFSSHVFSSSFKVTLGGTVSGADNLIRTDSSTDTGIPSSTAKPTKSQDRAKASNQQKSAKTEASGSNSARSSASGKTPSGSRTNQSSTDGGIVQRPGALAAYGATVLGILMSLI